MRRVALLLLVLIGALSAPATSFAAGFTMIKDPDCGCCAQHAAYLRERGYKVEIQESNDLSAVRTELGVPEMLVGCHIILAEGYVIEGHVPVAAIDKLLAERPEIIGISVPGMPAGSPGMDGEKTEPLVVFEIAEGMPRVFMAE